MNAHQSKFQHRNLRKVYAILLPAKDCYKFDSLPDSTAIKLKTKISYFLSRLEMQVHRYYSLRKLGHFCSKSPWILCRPRLDSEILCSRQRRKTCLFTARELVSQKIFMIFQFDFFFVCLDKSACKQTCGLNKRVEIFKQLCQSFLSNDLFLEKSKI